MRRVPDQQYRPPCHAGPRDPFTVAKERALLRLEPIVSHLIFMRGISPEAKQRAKQLLEAGSARLLNRIVDAMMADPTFEAATKTRDGFDTLLRDHIIAAPDEPACSGAAAGDVQ